MSVELGNDGGNAGQIKINFTTPLTSGVGFTANQVKEIPLTTNYTVSSFPTTTYPFLAKDRSGGSDVINPTTLCLRELKAGQSAFWRITAEYVGKQANLNGNISLQLYNPNPASSFAPQLAMPTPDDTPVLTQEFLFLAIADGASLNPLYGYKLRCRSTFASTSLEVRVTNIVAQYLATGN